MSELLQNRLSQLRRGVRRLLWLHGISWLLVAVLGGLLGVGLLDWMVHINDAGIRLLLGLAVLGGAGWVAWRFLAVPLWNNFSDVELALRLERRFPDFKDSLASTVQFLRDGPSARIGSPRLRQQVIQETVQRFQNIDVNDVVDVREVRRMALVAVCLCGLTAVVVGLNQAAAATALHRVVFPFSAASWPRETELQLVTDKLEPVAQRRQKSIRVARGSTLELFVRNVKGDLPSDTRLEFRLGDGPVHTKSLRSTTLHGPQGEPHHLGATRLTINRGPVQLRAIGGDDHTMRWHTVEAVRPPQIADLAVKLQPPAYSGRKPQQRPAGVGHVEGLVGTKVTVEASAEKPLASARLRIKSQQSRPVKLSQDGRRFRTSFVIHEPGVYSYWFDLQDRQGFENGEAKRYEIHGIADRPPKVSMEQPDSDLQVTADAEIPLRIAANDDLGLNRLRLRYKRSGSGDLAGSLFLHQATQEKALQETVIEETWRLAELALPVGTRLVYHAEATDHYDLDSSHIGRSITRALRVVSPEKKKAELASRQVGLLQDLEAVAETQKQVHGQVDELHVQLEKAGRLQSGDLDLLKRSELDQRRVSSQLFSPQDGVGTRLRQLLAEMQHNKLDDSSTRKRLEGIAEELSFLRDNHLPAVKDNLTRARKTAEAAGSPGSGETPKPDRKDGKASNSRDKELHSEQLARALQQAATNQAAVVQSLEAMLGRLKQWRQQRDLGGELDEIVTDQKSLNQATAELGRETLTKSPGELTAQQKADLARLAQRQQRQAQRLDELQSQLAKTADKLADEDPGAADRLRAAAEELQRRSTTGQMRDAAAQLENNQVGQAAGLQQQILKDLEELNRGLGKPGDQPQKRRLQKLAQSEDDLARLQKKQEDLRRQAQEILKQPAPSQQQLQKLTKRQERLQKETDQVAQQLRRLQARDSSRSAGRAASGMKKARNELAQKGGGEATQRQQQALEDLKQARREAARTKQELQEQLARERLEKMSDELKGMVARQKQVIEETRRLEQARQQRGNWSRAQLKSLSNLAEIQQGLRQETDHLAEEVEAAEVFALALQGASRNMQTAAGRLQKRKTGSLTVAAETRAKQRFLDLMAALKSEKTSQASNPSSGGDSSRNSGPQGESISPLTQFKLLKTLQEDINVRTEELHSLQSDEAFTDEQAAELRGLANEQRKLADLARNLSRHVRKPAEAKRQSTKDR